MTDSTPHSELMGAIKTAEDAASKAGWEGGYCCRMAGGIIDAQAAALQNLEKQVQSLELACDHHKMFWQKAEERERGLKEQLGACEELLRALVDAGVIRGEWAARVREALNPASRSDS